jgi:hypothetical protein
MYKSMNEHKNAQQGEFLPPPLVDGATSSGPAMEKTENGYYAADSSLAAEASAEADNPSDRVKELTHHALYKITELDTLWTRERGLKSITIGFIRDRSNSKEFQSYVQDYADVQTDIWHGLLTAETYIAKAIGVDAIPLTQAASRKDDWKVRVADRDESDYFKQEFKRVLSANRDACRGTTPKLLKRDIENGRVKVVYPVPYRTEPQAETLVEVAKEAIVEIPDFTPEEKVEAIHNELDALTAIGVYHQRLGNGQVDFNLRMGNVPLKEIMSKPMPKRKPEETAYNYLRRCSPIQVRKAIIGWYGQSTGIPKLRESGAFKKEDLDNAATILLDKFLSRYTYEPASHEKIKNYNVRKGILDSLATKRNYRKKELLQQEEGIIQKKTGQYVLDLAGATKAA